MNRCSFVLVVAALFTLLFVSCSNGGNPFAPPEDQLTESQPIIMGQATNTYLLNYYDIYFDFATKEFEAVDNRTADFTLNIVAFLNLMTVPKNGIMFEGIVLHQEDPEIFGVDVDFKIFHPFPGFPQYKVYDLMGVLITDGSDSLIYQNLRHSVPRVNTYMKNPDGYTRWFNPSEFTTNLIFGYTPGGWQNKSGNANLNPYKYYSTGLSPSADAFDFLKNGPNYDGLFQTGLSRRMEIDFPMVPVPGILFGYAVVVTWEDFGVSGPSEPYHAKEALACDATITPDVYFDGVESGGDIIVDIDLFSWDEQPSTIKIESSVLNQTAEFDAATYGAPVDEHVSTYHIEVGADEVLSTAGNDLWIIAEYDGYDYKNGLPDIPSADGALAAFFRFDLPVLSVAPYYQLHLVQPNGFETLIVGQPYDIKWTSKNITGTVNIWFSNEGMTKPLSQWEKLFEYTPNDGVESWVPTDEQMTDNGRLLIFSTDFPTEAYDFSNYDFVVGMRDITVTQPNGGENLTSGTPYEVKWTSQNVDGLVTIEYSKNSGGTYPTVIFSGTDNDGTEMWTPTLADISSAGRIRITSDNYPGTVDASDADFAVLPPLKNIDITNGGNVALDICVDHNTGDVLVLYNNGRVRRWIASSFYASYTSDVLTNIDAQYIDMALDGTWFVDYTVFDIMNAEHFNSSDAYVGWTTGPDGSGAEKYAIDAATIYAGSYQNYHAPIFGYTTTDPTPIFRTVMDRVAGPAFNTSSPVYYNLNSAGTLTGADRVKYNWIRAAEGDPTFGTIWFVESSDYYAANFDVMGFTYQSKAFGTGTQTAGDTGIYDPKDLTCGELNHMYLLDYCGVALGYRIKAFDHTNGAAITPSLHITGITGTPLRIDGTPALGIVVLLSTQATNSYISIYTASETP